MFHAEPRGSARFSKCEGTCFEAAATSKLAAYWVWQLHLVKYNSTYRSACADTISVRFTILSARPGDMVALASVAVSLWATDADSMPADGTLLLRLLLLASSDDAAPFAFVSLKLCP